jgi:hypothetical protein
VTANVISLVLAAFSPGDRSHPLPNKGKTLKTLMTMTRCDIRGSPSGDGSIENGILIEAIASVRL